MKASTIVAGQIGDIHINWGNLFKARGVPVEAQPALIAAYEANKESIDAKIAERVAEGLSEGVGAIGKVEDQGGLP